MAKPEVNANKAEDDSFIAELSVGKNKKGGESKFDTFTRGKSTMTTVIDMLSKNPKTARVSGKPIKEIYSDVSGGKKVVDQLLMGLALERLGASRAEIKSVVFNKNYAKDA